MVGGAMNSSMTRAVWGALAGVAGGLAMTLMIQKVAPNVLPEAMRPDGFAPKKAVEWTEAKTEHPEALTERQEMKAAMVGHLGYNAAAGAVYGVAREDLRRVPAPLTGAALGLVLWGLSFEGWKPAVGISAPPKSPWRNGRRPLWVTSSTGSWPLWRSSGWRRCKEGPRSGPMPSRSESTPDPT
jgi:hypothetical protein